MTRLLTILPLLVLPLLAYHVTIIAGGSAALETAVFSVPMISGGQWRFTLSDALLVFALAMLFVEIVKATSTRSSSLFNHGLSTALLIICLVEFLLLKPFATSTFFLIMVMTLLDVIAGFMVTIVAARRDFGVGDHLTG